MINKRTVLITSMGMLPSVLTETVWSLAHQTSPVIPDDNIVSPTYGHWGDWDLEAWMEENLHIPVLAVGIKRDSCNNPYRCFRFVMMDAK